MPDVYVSDFTKKTLMQFGWTEKDGVPDDIGEFLLKAKDRAAPSTRTDVLIDINTMLPEDIAAAQQLISKQRVKDQRERERAAFDETTKNMAPSVAAAYGELLEMEANAPAVIDDRDEAPAVDDEAAAAFTTAPIDDAEEPPPPVVDDTPPPPVVLPFCPRCGWDMRVKFDVEVTDEDKSAFLATLLGESRFKKRHEFAGGHFNVTFRSLKADENNEIYRQVAIDEKNGETPAVGEWLLRMFEYRLACSLDLITDKAGKPLEMLPPLIEMMQQKHEEPPLKQLHKQMRTVLQQEVTRRLVSAKFKDFQRLYEALEAQALEPSFWDGIG